MELLGHTNQIEDVFKEIVNGPTAQSYLFVGPRAIGKFQAALHLATRLVGEQDFESTTEALYPADVLVLEPGTATDGGKTKQKGIGVEEIRHAIQFLTRYPSKGKYRILIIRDAHVLAPAGQNMILKTLEEPPESALIMLVTHEPGALLDTVRSRVSEKVFWPVESEELAGHYTDDWLSAHAIPPFFRNFGRPGILEEAAKNSEQFQKNKDLLSQLYRITQLRTKERLQLAEELAKDTPQTIELLEWWLTGLRSQVERQEKKEQKVQFYVFLKNVFEVIETLKTTQGNARLLLEQLFFQIR